MSKIWKHKNNIIFNRGKDDVTKVFQVKFWIYSKFRFRMFSFFLLVFGSDDLYEG